MSSRIQLHAGAGRGSRGGDDASTEWLIQKLTRRGADLSKKERQKRQVAASEACYQARRGLWLALMAYEPLALATALRVRAATRDDYSNRKGVDLLRVALAEWLEGWDAEQVKRETRAARRGKTYRRQLPLWGPETWPTLAKDNEKAIRRAWPHVDLVADRDGQVFTAVSSASKVREVVRARRRMGRALAEGVEWNGRLVVATLNSKFFAGDSLTLSTSDLLSIGEERLSRALWDFNPAIARPSTYFVTWIAQGMRRAIEGGTLIHVPTWIRDANAAIRRGSPAWQKADKARRLAESAARKKGRDVMAAGANAYGKALRGVAPAEVIPPLDPPEVHRACEEIAAGCGRARLLDLLTGALGMEEVTAEAVAAKCDRIAEGGRRATAAGDERVRICLGPLAAAAKSKPDTLRKAVATMPHYVDSVDRKGRVKGDDDDDDRPSVILVSQAEDGAAEAEAAVMARQLGEALDALCETGPRGEEQAEVVRRSHGLAGPEEALVAIASEPLQSTGREINRNQARELRDSGIAWLARWMEAEPEEAAPVHVVTFACRGWREGAGRRLARAARRIRSENKKAARGRLLAA